MYLATAIAIFMILKWKKIGFYGLCVIQIITITRDELGLGIEAQLVTCIIQTLVIFAILQLRNACGISTWKQMI
jgi:hypothetical protein